MSVGFSSYFRFASPLQIQPASGNSVMNVVDTRYNPVASH
jgi:hypothetical protein